MEEKNIEVAKQKLKQNNEKPFYKKWWFVVGTIVLIIVVFNTISNGNNKTKWSELELGKYIPEAKKGKIDVGSNLDDYLSMSIENVSKSYYQEYKNDCIKMGYTVESKSNGDRYEAFNNDGYELSLSYISDDIWIILQAPEEMKEIEWTSQGLSAMLPKPSSTYGKIVSDSSNSFRVHIGKTTIDEFNKYVTECQNKGFNVDYNKQEENYYAKNSDGYRLSVNYLGFNTIDILIQVPEKKEDSKEETNNSKVEEKQKNETSTNNNNNSNEIRKEFKDAMDSYEKYMDEYVAFMKKYNANPSDMSLLNDYGKMLEKYNQFTKDFEKWKDNDLNTAETSYYLDVQTRVTKKLLEVAN